MASVAANPTLVPGEVRRAPVEMTNFGGLMMVGGALLLLVLAGYAKATGTADNHMLTRFWHAYLLNASFAASISLGGLFFVIAHHLTGGRWGTSLRRLAEIVAGTMVYSAALFIPILLNVAMGSDTLYEWGDRALVAGDAVLASKANYLSPYWFVIRTAIYFGLWLLMVQFFTRSSLAQDETGKVATLRRLSAMSGPAMVVFALAINFAAFDWLMSLAPHWFSTMFGVYFFAGSFGAFLAVLLLLAHHLQSRGVLTHSITTDNLHDVAKLMYAFVVFWGYITFSQFMLIWYANIPEETEWYGARQPGGPTMFGIPFALGLLFILHLIVPFLGFMSRTVRRNKAIMTFWAAYMLVVHWIDLAFIVLPGAHGYADRGLFSLIGLFEILCLVGVAAILIGAILRGSEGKWLIPVRDPRLHQAMTYHNH